MSAEESTPPGRQEAPNGRPYETKVVQAIRGTESRAEAKWRKDGWELVSQNQGTLRTEMTFRRTKPKTFGAYLAQGYTAFRGLQPKTQQVLAAVVGGLVLVLLAVGMFAATLGGDGAPGTAATPTGEAAATEASAAPDPQPTAEPSKEETTTEDEPTQDATEDAPTEEPSNEPEPYTYGGPDYETIAVDEDVVLGELDQHWVLVDSLDASAADFEDQVKLIISDVVHEEGTADLSVSVVTDPEIAAYRSGVTGPTFLAENGQDYIDQVVRPKEQNGFLAWYTGGFDPNDQTLSTSDEAYEVFWLPASDSQYLENWKPTTGAS